MRFLLRSHLHYIHRFCLGEHRNLKQKLMVQKVMVKILFSIVPSTEPVLYTACATCSDEKKTGFYHFEIYLKLFFFVTSTGSVLATSKYSSTIMFSISDHINEIKCLFDRSFL